MGQTNLQNGYGVASPEPTGDGGLLLNANFTRCDTNEGVLNDAVADIASLQTVKIDKVGGAAVNRFASFASGGGVQDSGYSAGSFSLAGHTHILSQITDAGSAASYDVGAAELDVPILGLGGKLNISTIPTLTLSLISDAGTVCTRNTGTGNGNVPILDSNGKLSIGVFPGLALNDTFVVASQAAMLALTAETGDLAVRTDVNKTFILKGTSASTLTDWQELLTPTDLVQSVNGMTGTVSLTTSNVAEGSNLYHTTGRVQAIAPNVTIGSPANGLSLSTQQLSLAVASGSSAGAMSSAHYSTLANATEFNTASTLMLRDSSGYVKAGYLSLISGMLVTYSEGSYYTQIYSAANNQSITMATNSGQTNPLLDIYKNGSPITRIKGDGTLMSAKGLVGYVSTDQGSTATSLEITAYNGVDLDGSIIVIGDFQPAGSGGSISLQAGKKGLALGGEVIDGANGSITINDAGYDTDLRIEGDTDENLFFIDASADFVGIGTSTPSTKLQVNGTITATTFSGSGASITSMPAANLTGSNTLPAGVLPTTVMLTNASSTLSNAVNIAVGTTTGTKIGTSTSQKLGFFNATPIVQPSSTTDLRTALISLGLYATGGASPLNLNGGVITALATGLTSIPAANLTGSIADARLSANVVLANATTTISGAYTFSNTLQMGGTINVPSTIQHTWAPNNYYLAYFSGGYYMGMQSEHNSRLLTIVSKDSDGVSRVAIEFLVGSGPTRVASLTTDGYFGVGNTGTAWIDAKASTTAAASIRMRTGTAPTSPNDGDMWQDGTNFKIRINGVTKTVTLT